VLVIQGFGEIGDFWGRQLVQFSSSLIMLPTMSVFAASSHGAGIVARLWLLVNLDLGIIKTFSVAE